MKISSFDIFDTCLLRKCGTPENLFLVLGREIMPDASDQELMLFVNIRIESEEKARQESWKEITIEDIYRYADFSVLTSRTNLDIKQKEIELETSLWVPVYNVKKIIRQQRQKGHSIIFISDMYLPTAIIKDWLQKEGFWRNGDSVYVSGECGYTKVSGQLFRFVGEQLNAKYFDWHHFGNDKESDYHQPRKLGICAHLLSISDTLYQAKWQRHILAKYQHASIGAGISRSIRASYPPSPNVDFAVDLIAPLLCSYVYRVLKDAAEKGIEQLFFASRDGKILLSIAKQIYYRFPTIKRLDYFYISRQALKESRERDVICYFEQIGLANKDASVGIVDTGSSGGGDSTFNRINTILQNGGYPKVKGYFWHYLNASDKSIYGEVSAYPLRYLNFEKFSTLQMLNSYLIEGFFTMTEDLPLKSYKVAELEFQEVDDVSYYDKKQLSHLHFEVCERWMQYADKTHLTYYMDAFFVEIALPTLFDFWLKPSNFYVKALLGYSINNIPFVQKISFLHLVKFLFGTKLNKLMIWKNGGLTLTIWGQIVLFGKQLIKKIKQI